MHYIQDKVKYLYAPKDATHYTNDKTAYYRWLKEHNGKHYFYNEELHKWTEYPVDSPYIPKHFNEAIKVPCEKLQALEE